MSVGGGVVLLVFILVNSVYSDTPWMRNLCRIYMAAYLIIPIGMVIAGELPVHRLAIVIVFLLFGFFLLEVKNNVNDDI